MRRGLLAMPAAAKRLRRSCPYRYPRSMFPRLPFTLLGLCFAAPAWLGLCLAAPAWLGLCLATPAQTSPPVTLAVHLLVACSAPGAGQPVRLPGVEASRCLDRTPFLTQNDVASAEFHTNSKGHPTVFLTFREEAAVRELDITRRNVGNRVGIVVNGRIVSAPEVASSSRLLYIDGNYTEKEVQALVAAFNKVAAIK